MPPAPRRRTPLRRLAALALVPALALAAAPHGSAGAERPRAEERSVTFAEPTATARIDFHPGDTRPLVGERSTVQVGIGPFHGSSTVRLLKGSGPSAQVVASQVVRGDDTGAGRTAFTIRHARAGSETYRLLHVASGLTSAPWTVRTTPQKAALRTVYSPSQPVVGSRAAVTGKVVGGRRPLMLESRARGRWVPVARSASRADGTFRLRVPTPVAATARMRVTAAGSAPRGAVRSAAKALRVIDRWQPTGTTEEVPPEGEPGGEVPEPTPQVAPQVDPQQLALDAVDFTLTANGARWNPCATIGVRLNSAGAPATAEADTVEALRRVNDASGLRLTYLGTTTVVPEEMFLDYPADTQVVIAWTSPAESSMLASGEGAVGVGGFVSRSGWLDAAGNRVWATQRGGVVLDRGEAVAQTGGFGAGDTVGELLMHEVGHVVGLGHAARERQVMYPFLTGQPDDTWGPGDLAGLQAVGASQGCLTPAS